MALTCRKSWLIALALQMLLATVARAQVPPYAVSSDPTAFAVADGSLFAPSQLSLFGRGPEQTYGYFGTAEFLLWSISNPTIHDFGRDGQERQVYVNNSTQAATTTYQSTGGFSPFNPVVVLGAGAIDQELTVSSTITVQNPTFVQYSNVPGTGLTTERNSLNTSWLAAPLTGGFRTDFGYIDEETDRGWLFSVTSTSQSQNNTTNSVSAVFEDGTNNPALQSTLYNGLQTLTASTTITTSVIIFGTIASPTTTLTLTAQSSALQYAVQQPIHVPLLYGFIGSTNTSAQATAQWPNGFAADLNRNDVYGAYGRDIGQGGGALTGGTTGGAATPNDGIPDMEASGAPPIPVDYGDLVPLPLVFTNVQSSYKSTLWSVEANRLLRIREPGKFGGRWDVFGGVRYIDFSDIYNVVASGGILDTTSVNVNAYNRIVGPQIGFRWTKPNGKRLTFSTESRLIGGANFQTIRQNGLVGANLTQSLINPLPAFTIVNGVATPAAGTTQASFVSGGTPTTNTIYYQSNQPNNPGQGIAAPRLNQPLTMQPSSFNNTVNHVVFNPVFELRANLNYQLFRRVSVAAGWTGLYIDGVARSSGMTDFVLPSFQLSSGNNHSGVFVNGLNLSFIINR